MRLRKFPIFLITLLITVMSQISHGQSAKNSSSVVLLSFEATKAGPFAVLQDGLRSMLISRLATIGGITPLESSLNLEDQQKFPASAPSEKAKIFTKLGADYIATATMIDQDNRLLIDMLFFAKAGGQPIAVSMEARAEQQIFTGIEILAQQIAEKVFGHTSVVMPVQKKTAAQEGIDAFRTDHPDKKYKEEVVSGPALVQGNSAVEVAGDDLVRRRATLATDLVVLAVNPQGQEIFVASDKDLRVYRFEQGLLQQQAEYVFAPSTKVHGLNVIDMDGNGSVEIFLSAVVGEEFSSSILAWTSEGNIHEVMGKIRYGIRPLVVPGKGLVVGGQAKAAQGDNFLAPESYILDLDMEMKRVKSRQKLFLPGRINLFDFVYADVDGDGQMEKVAITGDMKMAVYDQENNLIWLSEDDFGGSVKGLGERWREKTGTPKSNYGLKNENYFQLQYVPVRLLAMDIDGDGKMDIVSAKNALTTFRALHNLRSFSGGNVVCMSWDGKAMTESWKTDTLGGYITDFSLKEDISGATGNASGGGVGGKKLRLYVGELADDGLAKLMTFSDGKANIHFYQFRIIDKSQSPSKVE